MRRFIINILIYFAAPGLLFCITAELLLRNIPGTYAYKKEYMETNAKDLEVLILGGSNSFFNIDPAYLNEKAFNLSNVLQTFNFDSALIDKYASQLTNLKCLVIPISNLS